MGAGNFTVKLNLLGQEGRVVVQQREVRENLTSEADRASFIVIFTLLFAILVFQVRVNLLKELQDFLRTFKVVDFLGICLTRPLHCSHELLLRKDELFALRDSCHTFGEQNGIGSESFVLDQVLLMLSERHLGELNFDRERLFRIKRVIGFV